MSQVANILVTNVLDTIVAAVRVRSNSATVGYNKTFAPEGKTKPNVWKYVDRSGGIQVGYPSYELEVKVPDNSNRNLRVIESIVYPVMNISSPSTGSGIQPLPSVGYRLRCNTEWVIPEAAVLADRQILFALRASMLAGQIDASDGAPTDPSGSPIRTLIETGEQVYG